MRTSVGLARSAKSEHAGFAAASQPWEIGFYSNTKIGSGEIQ
jgi:hypothetical protein